MPIHNETFLSCAAALMAAVMGFLIAALATRLICDAIGIPFGWRLAVGLWLLCRVRVGVVAPSARVFAREANK